MKTTLLKLQSPKWQTCESCGLCPSCLVLQLDRETGALFLGLFTEGWHFPELFLALICFYLMYSGAACAYIEKNLILCSQKRGCDVLIYVLLVSFCNFFCEKDVFSLDMTGLAM